MTYWVIPGLEPPRVRCLALENLRTVGFTSIPWTEKDVRDLLNHLRTQEITPHKLQGIWDTLRWFSSTFGLLEVDSLEQLQAKRENHSGISGGDIQQASEQG